MPAKEVMSEFRSGDLHSGSKTGKIVNNPKQAKAILLSELRNEGKIGPRKPKTVKRNRKMIASKA